MTGSQLKSLRTFNELTQVELAQKLGTYQTRVSGWEVNNIELPQYIDRIIELLIKQKTLKKS